MLAVLALAIAAEPEPDWYPWWDAIDPTGWTYAANTPDGARVVFWQGASQNPKDATIWVRMEHRERVAPGEMSNRMHIRVNCAAATYTMLEVHSYKDRNLKNELGNTPAPPVVFDIPPRSLLEPVLKAACGR